jgi:hypothetical protein
VKPVIHIWKKSELAEQKGVRSSPKGGSIAVNPFVTWHASPHFCLKTGNGFEDTEFLKFDFFLPVPVSH